MHGERSAKKGHYIFYVGPHLMKNATRCKICDKTAGFSHISHRPPRSPGLLDFCGTSSRHSSFSIQLLPIPQTCGPSDARVSQDVDRQPSDVRKDRCCMGPQANGLRGRRRRFFSSRPDVAGCIVPLKDTAQKHVIQHVIYHFMALSTDTDNTFPKWSPPPLSLPPPPSPDLQTGSRAHFSFPKPWNGPLGSVFFFFSVPQVAENTIQK